MGCQSGGILRKCILENDPSTTHFLENLGTLNFGEHGYLFYVSLWFLFPPTTTTTTPTPAKVERSEGMLCGRMVRDSMDCMFP